MPMKGQLPTKPLRVPELYVFSLGICMLLHAEKTYVPSEFVAFYGFDYIEHGATVEVGEILTSFAEVTEMRVYKDNGIITFAHRTVDRRERTVVSSVQRMMVRRRDAIAGEGGEG
jgi:acyl dehydratase